jgi:mannose-6-phosphate isomerase-like protein (cupin superfamily)
VTRTDDQGRAANSFTGDARERTAVVPGARWLVHAKTWRPTDPDATTTGDHETAVILLGGTFDLVGNGTVWPARGTRKDPFTGRPMAVFLPPRADFRVGNGSGEILLIAARQQAVGPAPEGRDALSHKPLLPLAGSGKAFDPKTGDWLPAEAFPSAAESLPPRRFERIAVGPVTIERVFAPDYKAATLSVDEVVLQPGQELALGDVPRRPACDEVLVFVRGEGQAQIGGTTCGGGSGDAALLVSAAAIAATTVRAVAGRCYVVLAWAGKGASGS